MLRRGGVPAAAEEHLDARRNLAAALSVLGDVLGAIRAVAELCDLINATEAVVPGTSLRLRYAVAGVEAVT